MNQHMVYEVTRPRSQRTTKMMAMVSRRMKYSEGLTQPTVCVESQKRLTHESRR